LFGEQSMPLHTVEDIADMTDHEAKTEDMKKALVKRHALIIKYLAGFQSSYEEVTRRLFAERVMRPQALERQQRRDQAQFLRDQAAALESGLPPKSKKRKKD